MSISTPPPPQKKKSGCGCFGCGCALVIILIILFLALIGASGYFGYKGLLNSTTTAPADIPTFTATESSTANVQQKLVTFRQSTDRHQPATLHLTADEINNLISQDPDFEKKNIRTYVSMTGEQGQLKASVPIDSMMPGVLSGRFLNFDVTFSLSFDQAAKAVILTPKSLQIGPNVISGDTSDTSDTSFKSSFNNAFLKSFMPSFNQAFNQGLRKNPDIAKFLDQTQTLEIKDSELVIRTQ